MRANHRDGPGINVDRHSRYNQHQRYNNNSNFNGTNSRPYNHSSHRSNHSPHSRQTRDRNSASQYQHRQRSSLHSQNSFNSKPMAPRSNTHNPSPYPHRNRNTNSHNNNYSRNHTRHPLHRSSTHNPPYTANGHNTRNHSPTHHRGTRSRNIRNLNTSHSALGNNNNNPNRSNPVHIVPIVNLIDTSSKPPPKKSSDLITNIMQSIRFSDEPFMFDYQSRNNLCLAAAKCGVARKKIGEKLSFFGTNQQQQQQKKMKKYLKDCLKLIDDLMCTTEATDFICDPTDKWMNPEYYAVYEQLENDRHDSKNMHFEYIEAALKNDYYETVLQFASDVRLIWQNTYKLFGRDHEWSKNAQILERKFEENVLSINANVESAMFMCNGNPENDPKQETFLQNPEIQKEIELTKRNLEESVSMDVDRVQSEQSLNVEEQREKEKENEREQRRKYLENIETNKNNNRRKRASKQRLKSNSNSNSHSNLSSTTLSNSEVVTRFGSIECEEGEILNIVALDQKKLDETDVWFEFIRRHRYMDDIRKVIMIEQGLRDKSAFDAYKKKLHSLGKDLCLHITDKSAETQYKIYQILESAKNKIIRSNVLSVNLLNELIESKAMERKRGKAKSAVLDPYSKEALELKHSKEKEREAQAMAGNTVTEEVQAGDVVMDHDSDESFDDGLYFEEFNNVDYPMQSHSVTVSKVNTENNISNEIGMQFANKQSEYRPIRPSNVDQDIDNEMNDDNSKWDKFNYTKQQQGDTDEEEVDF